MSVMSYRLRVLAVRKPIAVVMLLACASWGFGQKPLQSFSSEDDRVEDFVQLPSDVLNLVLQDKESFPDRSSVRCEDHEQTGDKPRPEILCRKVLLSGHGEDYLVMGVGDLRGAHIVPFWLLHKDEKGAALIWKTASDQIEITPNRFNGYKEVRSTWIYGGWRHHHHGQRPLQRR